MAVNPSDGYSDAFRAVAVLYRDGAPIRRLKYTSISIDSALNEARESRIILADDEAFDFKLGDKVEIFTASCSYGTFYVTQWRIDSSESEDERTLFVSDCMYLLRTVGVSGATVFKNESLSQILALIPGYIKEETGDALFVSLVNPSQFEFTGRLDTDANNVLEMLRSVVIASGNAMRVSSSGTTCGIEVGMFGNDSGVVFMNGDKQYRGNGQYWCSEISRDVDASEVFTAVYCEGGGYQYQDQQWGLLMGYRVPSSYTSTPPAGFTLDLVNRFGVEYFRLRRNGYQIRSKRIQVAGLSPIIDENPGEPAIQAASQTLTNIAAKYLEKKSEPMEQITCAIPYPICNLPLGDRALVSSVDPATNQMTINDSYYITGFQIKFEEDSAMTQVTLSNVLFDPEDLTNASINKKADASAVGPNIAYKTVTGSVSVANANPVCQTTGRSATVNLASELFKSTPVITLTVPSGYTATVTSSSATGFTFCVVPPVSPTWPVTVNYTVVGVV